MRGNHPPKLNDSLILCLSIIIALYLALLYYDNSTVPGYDVVVLIGLLCALACTPPPLTTCHECPQSILLAGIEHQRQHSTVPQTNEQPLGSARSLGTDELEHI